MSITIEKKAFAKLMLHCLKHTKNDCYGILIGKNTNNSEDISVSDVVPVSHDKVFAPQLEIALKFIELNLDSGVEIIGIYENLLINNLKGTASISQLSYSILENIHNKKFKFPILLEIFSNEIISNEREVRVIKEEPVINMYRYSKLNNASSFDFVGMHKISQEQFDLMKNFLKQNKQNEIVDFDEHFLDADLDWRNTFLEI